MRTAVWTLMLVVAMACVLMAGCGTARQVGEAARMANDARDGKMTVTNEKGETTTMETTPGDGKSGKVTVTGKEGTTTWESGASAVKPEDVGVDFYPGATVESGASSTATGATGGKYSQVMLTTTDSFDAVAKFYKDKYATGNTVTEQPNMLMIMMGQGTSGGKMIMVTAEGGKTQVVISSGSQM